MKYLLLGILILVVLSCHRTETPADCNVSDPFEMQWIQNWINDLQFCTCTISVFQAKYNGETVFWQMMNDPFCQTIFDTIKIYNCNGLELLKVDNYESFTRFSKNVSEQQIIYSCSSR